MKPAAALRSRIVMAAAVVCAAAFCLSLIVISSGCGDSKSGGALSRDQYGRIEKGMTLDDVEAIAGQPYRTHRTGPAQDPDIVWYYSKSESDGLVRVSFKSGKVDNVSPYDLNVTPDE